MNGLQSESNIKVSGNKLNKKLAIGIPMVRNLESGKQVKDTANMWMHYVDWEVELQFDEYKNNAMAWGTSNRNLNGEYMNFGKSGNVIKTGAVSSSKQRLLILCTTIHSA